MAVRPKKHLGQHFLTNRSIASRIVEALDLGVSSKVLEVGPGKGILTEFLLAKPMDLQVVEIDTEAIAYLRTELPEVSQRIIEGDVLRMDFSQYFHQPFLIIGNFPYNISSQILFKIYDNRDQVLQVVGMMQKEVAQRIASPPGNKTYGILSVLLQAFYDVKVLFDVKPGSFHPPPKVDSSVIRLTRNSRAKLECDEALFRKVVKQGFQNRRKTLRNALKQINLPDQIVNDDILALRAEALGVEDYISLTRRLQL